METKSKQPHSKASLLRGRRKVFVAMSGGVDSSVAALLLENEGYEVVGIFMKNWSDTSFLKGKVECPWAREYEEARKAAAHIGIPLYTFDFEKEYKEKVVEYMIEGYKNGITPNPDVMCNKEIKFKLFLEKCLSLGADYIATGHYARVRATFDNKQLTIDKEIKNSGQMSNGECKMPNVKCQMFTARDAQKDQSYFLYTLGQYELSHTLFPIGDYTKQEVREIARNAGLPNAEKKDSQGICFVGDLDVFEFLKSQIPTHKGKIMTKNGKIVGEHEGVEFYTIGQRHGIGSPGGGLAYYVCEKDAENNILYVAEGEKDENLYQNNLLAKQPSWVAGEEPNFPLKCQARIRYRAPLASCVISRTALYIKVEFDVPQRAVAPGQSVVFYDGDLVLGGAVIA